MTYIQYKIIIKGACKLTGTNFSILLSMSVESVAPTIVTWAPCCLEEEEEVISPSGSLFERIWSDFKMLLVAASKEGSKRVSASSMTM